MRVFTLLQNHLVNYTKLEKPSINHLLAVLFISGFIIASPGGMSADRAGHPDDGGPNQMLYCNQCHGGGPGGGMVSLNGLPSDVSPSTTYDFTLTITDANAQAGGFQLVATEGATNNDQIGTFIAQAGSKLAPSGRVIHNSPKATSGGSVSWDIRWTSPATLPDNVVFYYSGNAVDFTGGTGGDSPYINNTSVPAAALPIELSNFSTFINTQNQIQLFWTTLSEQNNDFFEIQHSLTGEDFRKIGLIEAKGNSSDVQEYSFIHENAQQGINYYRLKQVDDNGKFSYSKVISIDFKATATPTVFPNPVTTNEMSLSFDRVLEENTPFEIFDNLGRSVMQQVLPANQNTYEIAVKDLNAGIYTLSVNNKTLRFVKR